MKMCRMLHEGMYFRSAERRITVKMKELLIGNGRNWVLLDLGKKTRDFASLIHPSPTQEACLYFSF
jgi:hypothetical protein